MSHICTEPHQRCWHHVFSSNSPGLWGKDYSIQLTVRKLRLRCKTMLGPLGFSNDGVQVRPLDQSLEVPPKAVALGTSKGTRRVQISVTGVLSRNEWIYSSSKGLSVCHEPGLVWALRCNVNRTGGLLAPWYLYSGEDGYEEVESRIIQIMRCHGNRVQWVGWGLIGSWL